MGVGVGPGGVGGVAEVDEGLREFGEFCEDLADAVVVAWGGPAGDEGLFDGAEAV